MDGALLWPLLSLDKIKIKKVEYQLRDKIMEPIKIAEILPDPISATIKILVPLVNYILETIIIPLRITDRTMAAIVILSQA